MNTRPSGRVFKHLPREPVGFCLFDLILYAPSTIFQLNRDGSSWVEPVLSSIKCVLLKDHKAATLVGHKPAAPRSRVKLSTTEPLHSPGVNEMKQTCVIVILHIVFYRIPTKRPLKVSLKPKSIIFFYTGFLQTKWRQR